MAGGMASSNSFVPLRHRLSTVDCCCVYSAAPTHRLLLLLLLRLAFCTCTFTSLPTTTTTTTTTTTAALTRRVTGLRNSGDRRTNDGQTKAQTRSVALGALLLLPPLPPPLVRSFSRTTLLIPSEKHCTITCSCAELGDCGDDDDNTTENDDGPRNETTA